MTTLVLCLRASLTFPQPPPLLHRLSSRCRRALQQALHTELRIDVKPGEADIEAELDALQRRLRTPGDPMQACRPLPSLLPGLIFHHREADGEHFIYVEDPSSGCLAGYTVFNRLVEVDRRTDRILRSPHSRYAPAYRGKGIATAVYEWALGQGLCLLSGARQSVGAHALWQALGRRHPLSWVTLRAKRMHELKPDISANRRTALETRLLLLGADWSHASLRTQRLLLPAADEQKGEPRQGVQARRRVKSEARRRQPPASAKGSSRDPLTRPRVPTGLLQISH